MKKNLYLVVSIILVVLVLISSWTFLTRKGYISNFLGWEVLCSERLENNTETIKENEKTNEVENKETEENNPQTNSQPTNTPVEDQKVNTENTQETPKTPQPTNNHMPKNPKPDMFYKPVIYLYPKQKQET